MMTQILQDRLQGATIIAALDSSKPQILAQDVASTCVPEVAHLDVDTAGAIDSAIAKIKELRFVFEHDSNLAVLQRLEDELLIELDLFDAAKSSLRP